MYLYLLILIIFSSSSSIIIGDSSSSSSNKTQKQEDDSSPCEQWYDYSRHCWNDPCDRGIMMDHPTTITTFPTTICILSDPGYPSVSGERTRIYYPQEKKRDVFEWIYRSV